VTRTALKLITVVAISSFTLATAMAQTVSRPSAATAQSSLLSSLPESDAIAQVQVNRLLTDVVPRVLANNPSKLAELNTRIDSFKF